MQSRIMAASQNTSDMRRYALHSASIDVPKVCAKAIVASRPKHSRIMVTNTAPVGEADEFPTPMPKSMLVECAIGEADTAVCNITPGIGIPGWTIVEVSLPSQTAREEIFPAIDPAKAWRES
jgi:hypothetical protein